MKRSGEEWEGVWRSGEEWTHLLISQLTDFSNLVLSTFVMYFCMNIIMLPKHKVGFLHTGFYSLVLTVCMHGAIAGDAYMQRFFPSHC